MAIKCRFGQYLSGGASNSDVSLSLGGVISSTHLVSSWDGASDWNGVCDIVGSGGWGTLKDTGRQIVFYRRNDGGDNYNFNQLNSPTFGTGVQSFSGTDESFQYTHYLNIDVDSTNPWLYIQPSATNWGSQQYISGWNPGNRVFNTMFTDRTEQAATLGLSDYVCIYFKLDHVTTTADIDFYFADTQNVDNAISLGLDPAGTNGTATTIADRYQTPAGVTFSQPTTGARLNVSSLVKGDYFALWLKRDSSALSSNSGPTYKAFEIEITYS